MNPHFLCNAMNALAALAPVARREVLRVTDHLRQFLPTSFDQQHRVPVPLAEELAVVRAYLDIESLRFGSRLKVERAIGVCDSGLTINPNLAKQCIEGGMIFGLSNAMYEQITLAGGAPEQLNFDEYQLLRIDAAPDVVCEIISVGEEPGSFGEVGTMPIGTALGNAIAAATGKRVRAQPYAANGVNFA